MHEALRQRLWRHIEALPDEQVYQVLDYIEFLASKYARDQVRPAASGLQHFSERLEDKMRGRGVAIRAISGTLDALTAADRWLNNLAEGGRAALRSLEESAAPPPPAPPRALGPGNGTAAAPASPAAATAPEPPEPPLTAEAEAPAPPAPEAEPPARP